MHEWWLKSIETFPFCGDSDVLIPSKLLIFISFMFWGLKLLVSILVVVSVSWSLWFSELFRNFLVLEMFLKNPTFWLPFLNCIWILNFWQNLVLLNSGKFWKPQGKSPSPISSRKTSEKQLTPTSIKAMLSRNFYQNFKFENFRHLSSLIVSILSRTNSQMALSAIGNGFPDNMMHCL